MMVRVLLLVLPWLCNALEARGRKGPELPTVKLAEERKGKVLNWRRLALVGSCVNPICAVLFNNYYKVAIPVLKTEANALTKIQNSFYRGIFRLRPRVVFTIGALLRGLQLTSPLNHLFDPSSGVGFGINLVALFAASRWPAAFVVGWALSKPFWKLLGANGPRFIRVPVAIGLERDIDKERKQKKWWWPY